MHKGRIFGNVQFQNFPGRHTKDHPLPWGESGLALIYAAFYASLHACENFSKIPDQISGRHESIDCTMATSLICKSAS